MNYELRWLVLDEWTRRGLGRGDQRLGEFLLLIQLTQGWIRWCLRMPGQKQQGHAQYPKAESKEQTKGKRHYILRTGRQESPVTRKAAISPLSRTARHRRRSSVPASVSSLTAASPSGSCDSRVRKL